MQFKKGELTFHQGPGGNGSPDLRTVTIHGVSHLHVETQAELEALHRLVAEGKPLPLKPAPGSKRDPSLGSAAPKHRAPRSG